MDLLVHRTSWAPSHQTRDAGVLSFPPGNPTKPKTWRLRGYDDRKMNGLSNSFKLPMVTNVVNALCIHKNNRRIYFGERDFASKEHVLYCYSVLDEAMFVEKFTDPIERGLPIRRRPISGATRIQRGGKLRLGNIKQSEGILRELERIVTAFNVAWEKSRNKRSLIKSYQERMAGIFLELEEKYSANTTEGQRVIELKAGFASFAADCNLNPPHEHVAEMVGLPEIRISGKEIPLVHPWDETFITQGAEDIFFKHAKRFFKQGTGRSGHTARIDVLDIRGLIEPAVVSEKKKARKTVIDTFKAQKRNGCVTVATYKSLKPHGYFCDQDYHIFDVRGVKACDAAQCSLALISFMKNELALMKLNRNASKAFRDRRRERVVGELEASMRAIDEGGLPENQRSKVLDNLIEAQEAQRIAANNHIVNPRVEDAVNVLTKGLFSKVCKEYKAWGLFAMKKIIPAKRKFFAMTQECLRGCLDTLKTEHSACINSLPPDLQGVLLRKITNASITIMSHPKYWETCGPVIIEGMRICKKLNQDIFEESRRSDSNFKLALEEWLRCNDLQDLGNCRNLKSFNKFLERRSEASTDNFFFTAKQAAFAGNASKIGDRPGTKKFASKQEVIRAMECVKLKKKTGLQVIELIGSEISISSHRAAELIITNQAKLLSILASNEVNNIVKMKAVCRDFLVAVFQVVKKHYRNLQCVSVFLLEKMFSRCGEDGNGSPTTLVEDSLVIATIITNNDLNPVKNYLPETIDRLKADYVVIIQKTATVVKYAMNAAKATTGSMTNLNFDPDAKTDEIENGTLGALDDIKDCSQAMCVKAYSMFAHRYASQCFNRQTPTFMPKFIEPVARVMKQSSGFDNNRNVWVGFDYARNFTLLSDKSIDEEGLTIDINEIRDAEKLIREVSGNMDGLNPHWKVWCAMMEVFFGKKTN